MARKKQTKGAKLVEQKQVTPKKVVTTATKRATKDSRPDAQTLPGRNRRS